MIDIQNLSVQFSGINLFEDVNLKILPTDKIALVGSNGTGKSTLLKIISNRISPETGNINYKKGLKIGYLPQEINSFNDNNIFDEVKNSIEFVYEISEEENRLNGLIESTDHETAEYEKYIHQLGELNHKKEELEFYTVDANIKKILSGLGFKDENFSQNLSELSGGWQMRVELAKILASNNNIILLDEPTNHLDIDSLTWLVKFLKSYKGAIILVSHDRYFVNNICSKTLEIYNNDVSFFKGNYNEYLNFKEERAERLKQEFADQQKKIKQTEQFIERFRYKATKAKQVQSRIKQLEKIDRIELGDKESTIHFNFYNSPPSGVVPIEIKSLSKNYDDNVVLKDINLQVERGEKIALLGPNGAGKTTLAKIISNKLNPTDGEIKLGHNTLLSFYAQDVVDNLNLENDIISELYESDSEYTLLQIRSILGAFLFNGEEVFKKIKVLSGGEKSRVALAKVLLNKANTIILDEPTNHLDFDSKKMLQDALAKFDGTLIIVSHDIDFLKPIISKVVEVRNTKIKEYAGGIGYYLLKKEEEQFEYTDENTETAESNKLTRKEQKRIEAEQRQKEYALTKDIKKKIDKIENKIAELEEKKNILEEDFTKEEVYSNPEAAKQNKIDYEKVKNELDEIYDQWTELSEKLEEITNNI